MYQLLDSSLKCIVDRLCARYSTKLDAFQLQREGSEILVNAFVADLHKRISELVLPHIYRHYVALDAAASSIGEQWSFAKLQKLFEGDGLFRFISERPLLLEAIQSIQTAWLRESNSLARCCRDDLTSALSYFGNSVEHDAISEVNLGLSDRHNGQSVAFIRLRSGFEIGFKPRSTRLDRCWSQLLTWCNARNPHWELRSSDSFEVDGRSWVRWLKSQKSPSAEDRDSFFLGAGRVACLLQLVQATDIHCENILAGSTAPIVVDLECLFHNGLPMRERGEPAGSASKASEVLRSSVVATGFLPAWLATKREVVGAVGGLNPAECYTSQSEFYRIDNLDHLIRESRPTTVDIDKHTILEKGEFFSLKDVSNVCAGYEEAYRFIFNSKSVLLHEGGPIAKFSGCTVRVIIRDSSEYYAAISKVILQLSHSRTGESRLDQLAAATLSIPELPKSWSAAIFNSEVSAISKFDIPLFHSRTNERHLYLNNHILVPNVFKQCAMDEVKMRLIAMNLSEMTQQLAILKASLDPVVEIDRRLEERSSNPHIRRPSSNEVDTSLSVPETALLYATSTAGELMRLAHRVENMGCAWIQSIPIAHGERANFGVTGLDLYSGAPGISLLFGSLARITQKDVYREFALECIGPLKGAYIGHDKIKSLLSKGSLGISGIGGSIYAISSLAEVLNEPSLLDEAEQLLAQISSEVIREDETLDIFGGVAGLLLCVERSARAGSIIAKSLITDCTNHLLEKHALAVREGSQCWVDDEGESLTGFAHGSSGISYALARSFALNKDPSCRTVIEASLNFEDEIYNTQNFGWPTGTKRMDRPILNQWCHGNLGILISRLSIIGLIPELDSFRPSESVIQRTLGFPESPWDGLCCGNSSRLELVRVLQRSGVPCIEQYPLELASRISARRANHGTHLWSAGSDELNPGLFTGVSGIALQLLVNAQLSECPKSILLLE